MARHPKRNVVFQPPSTAVSILLEGMAILLYIYNYIYIYVYIYICILLKPMCIPWVSHEIHVETPSWPCFGANLILGINFWGTDRLVISYSKLEDMPFQFKDVRWNTWWFTLIYWFRWFTLLYWFRLFTLLYWFRWFALLYWFRWFTLIYWFWWFTLIYWFNLIYRFYKTWYFLVRTAFYLRGAMHGMHGIKKYPSLGSCVFQRNLP